MEKKKVLAADMIPDQLYVDNGRVIELRGRAEDQSYVMVAPPGQYAPGGIWGIPVGETVDEVHRMAVGKPECPACGSRLERTGTPQTWSHCCSDEVCGWLGTYKELEAPEREDGDGGRLHRESEAAGDTGAAGDTVAE